MIPEWVMQRLKGKHSALALYGALLTYRNHGTGLCCPSQKTLAENHLGQDEKTVMRNVRVLEDLKLVAVKRGKKRGQNANNEYVFLDCIGSPTDTSVPRPPDIHVPRPPDTDVPWASQPPDTNVPRPSPVNVPRPPPVDAPITILIQPDEVEPDKELFIIDEPMTEPVADNGFDTFWANYPRKVGKGQAKKAYEKALKVAYRDEILAGAKRLADDPNLPELTYVKHASTWLAAESWTDEPFPARNTQNSKADAIAAMHKAAAEQTANGGVSRWQ